MIASLLSRQTVRSEKDVKKGSLFKRFPARGIKAEKVLLKKRKYLMADYSRNLLDWIIENKEWLFSGVGLVFITVLYRLLRKKHAGSGGQQQQTKVESRNLRAGGDIYLTTVLGKTHSNEESISINDQQERRLESGAVLDQAEEFYRNKTQRKAAFLQSLESMIQVTALWQTEPEHPAATIS